MLVTKETFGEACRHIHKHDRLTVDLETTGLEYNDKMVGVAVRAEQQNYYFPFRHGQGTNLPKSLIGQLMEILSDPNRTYIGFNFPFDLKMMTHDGARVPSKFLDVQIAAHLMSENEPSLALKRLADKYLGEGSSMEESVLLDKVRDLVGKGVQEKNLKGHMWRLDPVDVAPYACADVELTDRLCDFYQKPLERWGLHDLWTDVCDYSNILTRAEILGMQTDRGLIEEYAELCSTEYEKLVDQIAIETGGQIANPNSPVQVSRFFGGGSTDVEHLGMHIRNHGADSQKGRVARMVLDARGWSKCKTSYFDAYIGFMDSFDIIHTNMWVTGTYTGRLSCSKPNLQAVPRQDDRPAHKLVKNVFIARPGYLLLEADYSQAEMRIASYYGKEERMADLLRRGVNIHQATADDTGIDYNNAKRLNFSVVYGIGAKTYAENVHIAEHQAKRYLDAYHARYPGFKRLYRQMEQVARQKGYIRLFTGRIRHYVPGGEYHKASSNLVQGTVAEIIRIAMLRINQALPDVRQLLQVHDSTVMEIPEEGWEHTADIVKELMEDFNFDPKPKVDIKVGRSWGTMEKVA